MGETSDTLNIASASAADAGQYRCAAITPATGLPNDANSSIAYYSDPVRLTLPPVVSAAPVPTLSQWALLALALLLAGGAAARMRRKS